MKKKATFLAWDFNNIWKIDELVSYPYFQWQDVIPTPPPSSIETINGQDNLIKVYPNPTDGMIYIECPVNSAIKIYTLSGNLLLQSVALSEKEKIDLSAYPNGIYLLKVNNVMYKMIKK